MAVVYCIDSLTKMYEKAKNKANENITFDIHQGEIFGLLGPNGAGKSTLVNQITGLVEPTTGNILLFGMDVVKTPRIIADYVALQSQNTGPLLDLYPEEALFYTALLRGLSTIDARRQTNALIEEFQLASLLKKRLRRLSGGQVQIVNLAATFIGERPIQIFDEPTNNLDPKVRRQVWDKLLELNRNGTTIILVTHNVLEAERVVGRVGIINEGRLLIIGTPGELKARVDQRIRLEFVLKLEDSGYSTFFEKLEGARSLTPLHWLILCPRISLQQSIDRILTEVGLEHLDDFRILTPSLEDVYLQLGGDKKFD